jgi:hypothetical protein
MGDSEVDGVPADSKRDDDLESSLVLAVPEVMVGAVLVVDGRDEVELAGIGLRGASAEECEPEERIVSLLGSNAVSSPKRGLRFDGPIVLILCLPALDRNKHTQNGQDCGGLCWGVLGDSRRGGACFHVSVVLWVEQMRASASLASSCCWLPATRVRASLLPFHPSQRSSG